MTASKFNIKPHIALLVCNSIWACDYPFYNIILENCLTPLGLLTASLTAAALISLVTLLWEPAEHIRRGDVKYVFAAAVVMCLLRKGFLMEGLARTSPINGAVIGTVVPLLVLILSVAKGIDHFSYRKILGLVLGMGGAVAVIVTNATASHASSSVVGDVLIFCSGCCTAVYLVWLKGFVSRYGVATLMRLMYCVAAVAILPFGLPDIIHADYGAMHGRVLFALVFMLLVPSYLPNLLLNYSMRSVAPAVSGIYTYIQPVQAIILSVVMHLDKVHISTIIFTLIIFMGVGLIVRTYATSGNADAIHGRLRRQQWRLRK